MTRKTAVAVAAGIEAGLLDANLRTSEAIDLQRVAHPVIETTFSARECIIILGKTVRGALSKLAMSRFRINTMAGGTIVTVLLAGSMWFSIRGFEVLTDSQMQSIRAQEQEITLSERLRWSGESLTLAGRSYLISDDPALLTRLLRIRHEFDQSIAELRAGTVTPQSELLVAAVERDARRFVSIQEELLSARTRHGKDTQSLVPRFKRELLPLQHQLSRTLDDLVEYKQKALEESYRQAREKRNRVALLMHSLLPALILLGAAITLYFAKQTARAYRQEHDALEVARKAVAARDDLMGMVAHDLRNPLFAIIIRARTLQKLAKADPMRDQSESIITLATRMEHLIKSMLDVTSLAAGRFSVSPSPCAVAELIRDSVTMFDLIAAGRQIRLVRQIDQASVQGLVVLADRERVQQLFSNLIGNALKFAPAGSDVTIQAERQQHMVRFAVRDAGQGIAPENLRYVFDRFWKPHGGQTKGTGLGLFIAKGIAEAHGGRIWVESGGPGCGANFYFTLPLDCTQKIEQRGAESLEHGCVAMRS